MDLKQFINTVFPEHSRTSCSDDNISNGYYTEEVWNEELKKYEEVITDKCRCLRCGMLEIAEEKVVNRNDYNLFW